VTVVRIPPLPDLADIQGDILRAYGNAYRRTTYLFVHVGDPAQGRRWLAGLVDTVTSALPWGGSKPETTLNVALTCAGLEALGLSRRLLDTFSQEFQAGMGARAPVLGDVGDSAPTSWDSGLGRGCAHVLLIVNGLTDQLLDSRLRNLRTGLERYDALEIVHEEHATLLAEGREHFGYADGFAQPAVEGVTDSKAPGGGVLEKGTWRGLALGEFILGYQDEASRDDPKHGLPHAPADPLGRNGTYAVWRKLEQNVALFRATLRNAAEAFDCGDEAKLAAKIVGRWRNGTPLVRSPERPEVGFRPNALGANDFLYAEVDSEGRRCPLGAHIRRCNPRDSLGFEELLTFRHRMIRRGMPYGPPLPAGATEDDGQERGLVFVCYVASISRQFESVQIQWLEDGNAFGLAHDKDFLMRGPLDGTGKMTVPGTPPSFVGPQPNFVTMRGGEYLFVPGITALGILADGVAD
jgi:Dyp-type peroxidase family